MRSHPRQCACQGPRVVGDAKLLGEDGATLWLHADWHIRLAAFGLGAHALPACTLCGVCSSVRPIISRCVHQPCNIVSIVCLRSSIALIVSVAQGGLRKGACTASKHKHKNGRWAPHNATMELNSAQSASACSHQLRTVQGFSGWKSRATVASVV